MLINVKPFLFHTCRNAKSMNFIKCFEYDESHTCCPCSDNQSTEYLCPQENETVSVEYSFTDGEEPRQDCSEASTYSMYR